MGNSACSACKTNNGRISTLTVDIDPSKKSRKRGLSTQSIFTPTDVNPTTESTSSSSTSDESQAENSTNNWLHQILESIEANSDNDDEDNQTVTTQGESNNSNSLKPKPNLFRPDTTTPWDESDIEDLTEDMKKQLDAIVHDHIDNGNNGINISLNQGTFSVDYNNKNSTSNLIRTLSHDWDSDDMEINEAQMKKYLNHLKLQNNHSNHLHPPMNKM